MTTIANQITLDGTFTDWPANAMIMTANNTVAGYQVYGALLNDATLGDTYVDRHRRDQFRRIRSSPPAR